jgi:hypothetical protein
VWASATKNHIFPTLSYLVRYNLSAMLSLGIKFPTLRTLKGNSVLEF